MKHQSSPQIDETVKDKSTGPESPSSSPPKSSNNASPTDAKVVGEDNFSQNKSGTSLGKRQEAKIAKSVFRSVVRDVGDGISHLQFHYDINFVPARCPGASAVGG